ncbi:hypothetical protein [Vibrio parahaemolyticus]|uniref:hypothetical protein n=1 Tax=Vibrio parahaemolyticus TaxID=670 RepID=UPI001E638597|nr:hypothetical protein [Vibrio parahaemolyticus]
MQKLGHCVLHPLTGRYVTLAESKKLWCNMKLTRVLISWFFLAFSLNAQSEVPDKWQIFISKKIVIENKSDGYELALDTFTRNLPNDDSGESLFYVFLIHYYQKDFDHEINEYISLLEQSSDKGYPLAIATLYVIYSSPYLVSVIDTQKAKLYEEQYNHLIEQGKVSAEQSLDAAESTSRKLLGLYKS